MFLTKEERAALALKRRKEEVAALKKVEEEERAARQKYLEDASGQNTNSRRRWEGRDEEREKLREENLLLKDKEKEMDAIKVCICKNDDFFQKFPHL